MKLKIHKMLVPYFAVFVALSAISLVLAADAKSEPKRTIINNVNIFDGKSAELAVGMSVLVENNLIVKIAKSPIKMSGEVTVIAACARCPAGAGYRAGNHGGNRGDEAQAEPAEYFPPAQHLS